LIGKRKNQNFMEIEYSWIEFDTALVVEAACVVNLYFYLAEDVEFSLWIWTLQSTICIILLVSIDDLDLIPFGQEHDEKRREKGEPLIMFRWKI